MEYAIQWKPKTLQCPLNAYFTTFPCSNLGIFYKPYVEVYLGGKMVLWVLFIIDREWRRVLGHIQGIFFSEG